MQFFTSVEKLNINLLNARVRRLFAIIVERRVTLILNARSLRRLRRRVENFLL
ncbi:hypothetical protein MtrunA17_Chr3g0111231 [Medicago truncatula]|uniref:Uncharacterized protein n=1 Tax=Medicago truncatula TaxID=3880 RepID=A0A396IYZ8_MEDTR|nr:hypothetical protein MtrunA17_Chr3g0111231 [Medicago truncatula]